MSFTFSLAPSLSALVNLDHPPSQSSTKEPAPPPFEVTAANLQRIGAIGVDVFLQSAEIEHGDINYEVFGLNRNAKLPYIETHHGNAQRGIDQVLALEAACKEELGDDVVKDGLLWNLLEEDKLYTLTIIRPDGCRRYFECKDASNETDAKIKLARMAMGDKVLSFIREEHWPASIIEKCFKTHRSFPSRIQFFYFNADGNNLKQDFGAVLKVQLSATSSRLYFMPPTSTCALAAKYHCSRLAIEEGVLGYIESEVIEATSSSMDNVTSTTSAFDFMDLETFFNNLPRPFIDKSFDTSIELAQSLAARQLADLLKKAPTVSTAYYRVTQGFAHGCVLRVDDAKTGSSMTYLVEPCFKKVAFARTAVTIQAMSIGLKDFFLKRALSRDTLLLPTLLTKAPPNSPSSQLHVPTPAIEALANKIWPQILNLCHSMKTEAVMEFCSKAYNWGCTMTISIPPEELPVLGSSVDNKREYRVSPVYKRKAWARVAVCCLAAKEGVLEFLQHKGLPTSTKNPLTLQMTALLAGQNPGQDSSHSVETANHVFIASAPTATTASASAEDKGKRKREDIEEGEIGEDDEAASLPSQIMNGVANVNLPYSGKKARRSKKRKSSNIEGEVEDAEKMLKKQEETEQKRIESIVNEEVERFRLLTT